MYHKKTKEEVFFYYNDEIYDKIDWSIEPPGTLDFYYKEQAQRIRDSYDYVILCFSGGADSTNILNTFYYNNIKMETYKINLDSDDKNIKLNLNGIYKKVVDKTKESFQSSKSQETLSQWLHSTGDLLSSVAKSLRENRYPHDKCSQLNYTLQNIKKSFGWMRTYFIKMIRG